jgi:leucine dehydrogenase
MAVFGSSDFREHEQVVFCHDPAVGLRAIVAIHDTTLGPALGGLRVWSYRSEDEALSDVLRLSRGMTYKSALAGLPFGGGKAVLIAGREARNPALFERFGDFVERLNGRYLTAEDVGTSPNELEWVRRRTRHVVGIAEGGAGDPSPATAWGVFHGLRAAVRHKLGRDELKDLRVAVQGLGHVGGALCRHLVEAGCRLIVADVDAARARRAAVDFEARVVCAGDIHKVEAEVFAPCALGAVLNDRTIPELGASIVAGSANNQLAEDRHGEALRERGVLYAPDYVINAGGIINVSLEGPNYDRTAAFARIARIHDTLLEIFIRADAERLPTNAVADRIAEERLARARFTAGRARAARPPAQEASPRPDAPPASGRAARPAA